MINFAKIEKYKENNRIEAKKALGGLPLSIWETYSAFANTHGGIILLGVQEFRDKTFHTVNLPNADNYIQEFWKIINNPKKVSVNILSKKDVTIETIGDNNIIAIRVPKAQRSDKPVFIDNNPFLGSYRRNGEGDYKCTKDEVSSMIRDASIKTQDMKLLENIGIDVINFDSVKNYRAKIKINRPNHIWESLDDTDFLYQLGGVAKTADGVLHPTIAGLLMFGFSKDILKQFPAYSLEYKEIDSSSGCDLYKISSKLENWSGNIFDFYFQVYDRITQIVKSLFYFDDEDFVEDIPVHKALREALANCLINADYYGSQGVVITKSDDGIVFTNPGSFRIDVEDAKTGGVSDSRNSALIKMFNLVNIGESTGSGIPSIFNIWKAEGWIPPVIEESFEPDRITLRLEFKKYKEKQDRVKTVDKKRVIKTRIYRDMIISFLTKNIYATSLDISDYIGISEMLTKMILDKMINEDIVVLEQKKDSILYKLKA